MSSESPNRPCLQLEVPPQQFYRPLLLNGKCFFWLQSNMSEKHQASYRPLTCEIKRGRDSDVMIIVLGNNPCMVSQLLGMLHMYFFFFSDNYLLLLTETDRITNNFTFLYKKTTPHS